MQGDSAWPAVTYEDRPWASAIDVPRRWRATFAGPYQSAVPARIADLTIDLPGAVAATATEATAALAAFDTEVGDRLVPYGAILLRSESAASSRIERLTASARAIALAELGDSSRRNATEIVANTRAMRAALELADDLTPTAIIETHAVLLGEVDPSATGHWREQPVWIGTSNYGPHTAEFVPPHHELIQGAIDDLIRFMRRDDLPAIVQAALAHAQFETIHPFVDGNGRTGRALVHALLRAKGVTTHATAPVSAGLLSRVDTYFDALGAYRAGDPLPIIERFAEAAYAATVNGRVLVEEVLGVRQAWADDLRARPQAAVWRALDVVVARPVLDSALLQHELDVNAQAADAAIARLVEIGALEQITAGRRNRKYAAPDILSALDAFAEQGARRQ